MADPGQPGEIAQPHSGPGLVAGGPALDAGDRQVRRVLLHGEQVGPAQADGRGTRWPGVTEGEPPGGAGLLRLDADLGRGLVDLEAVGAVTEILPVRREQRGT